MNEIDTNFKDKKIYNVEFGFVGRTTWTALVDPIFVIANEYNHATYKANEYLMRIKEKSKLNKKIIAADGSLIKENDKNGMDCIMITSIKLVAEQII